MITRIFLVRHGATPLTADARFAGSRDVPLGLEAGFQVERLADRLLRHAGQSVLVVAHKATNRLLIATAWHRDRLPPVRRLGSSVRLHSVWGLTRGLTPGQTPNETDNCR
jgi:broad specificity phosphatase PhoE